MERIGHKPQRTTGRALIGADLLSGGQIVPLTPSFVRSVEGFPLGGFIWTFLGGISSRFVEEMGDRLRPRAMVITSVPVSFSRQLGGDHSTRRGDDQELSKIRAGPGQRSSRC